MGIPTTRSTSFESLGHSGDLFEVRAGAPIDEVLELASCRLAEVLELLREQAEHDEGLTQNMLYVTQELLEGTKAMVDACSSGLLHLKGRAGA